MPREKNKVYGITERKCAECGKMFIPAPLHVYKRQVGKREDHYRWFCSAHCLIAWDKAHNKIYL